MEKYNLQEAIEFLNININITLQNYSTSFLKFAESKKTLTPSVIIIDVLLLLLLTLLLPFFKKEMSKKIKNDEDIEEERVHIF